MRKQKNGDGNKSPLLETKDYWTGKRIKVNGNCHRITSGDEIFPEHIITANVIVIFKDEMYLLENVMLVDCGQPKLTSTLPIGVFIQTKKLLKQMQSMCKQYKFKTIKEKTSGRKNKRAVVGRRERPVS